MMAVLGVAIASQMLVIPEGIAIADPICETALTTLFDGEAPFATEPVSVSCSDTTTATTLETTTQTTTQTTTTQTTATTTVPTTEVTSVGSSLDRVGYVG